MLNWAITGTSFISTVMADRIRKSPGSRCASVFGRDGGKVQEFADSYAIGTATTDLGSILEDPSIDVVYVGLPNHLHRQVAEQALIRGKAVVCEKSLTVDLDDAIQLASTVNRTHGFFMEGYAYLHHPLIHLLIGALTSGKIGRLKSIQASYAADIAKFANPLGGGTIFNLGCYPISIIHLIFKAAYSPDGFERAKVFGTANCSSEGLVLDAAALIQFEGGLTASVYSSDSYGLRADLSIHGEIGTIVFNTNPWLPGAGHSSFEIRYHDGRSENFETKSDLDCFGHQIKYVEQCVNAGNPRPSWPAPTIDNSLEVMKILSTWQSACTAS